MNKKFNHICLPYSAYEKYYKESKDGKTYICPDTSSGSVKIHLFDNAAQMVLEYLQIGYARECGYDTDDMVLDFVSKYGFMKRNSKKVIADDLADEMHGLYLHFAEICSADYPANPEWILETEPIAAVTKRVGNEIFCEWQTKNPSSAVELAYTLLLCDEHRYIGLCKHCGRPFKVKNPKSEFCSAPCRNRYNVYKSRAKNG